MKLLLCFFLLSFFSANLCAQTSDAAAAGFDPVLNLIPEGWRGFAIAFLVLTPMIGRAWHALTNNGGLRGVWNALIFGTNSPKVLIACLCLLTLTSCDTVKAFVVKNEPLIEETIVYGTRQLVRAGVQKLDAKQPRDIQPR